MCFYLHPRALIFKVGCHYQLLLVSNLLVRVDDFLLKSLRLDMCVGSTAVDVLICEVRSHKVDTHWCTPGEWNR